MPEVPRSNRGGKEYEMIFFPEHYWRDHPGLTIAGCALSEARLLEYAKQLTKMRLQARLEAAEYIDTHMFYEPEVVN